MSQKTTPKITRKIGTLCLITQDDKILLAMKKRGFGEKKWNHAGGKPKDGELVVNAAIRETEEEIGIIVEKIDQIGEIIFHYHDGPEPFDFHVHIFKAVKWSGDPIESEEMTPQWFSFDEIPYKQMWEDDQYWLPQALSGKKLSGEVIFDKKYHIISHTMQFK